MERSHYGEVVAISRHWTPEHLDVTDVPMTYARPKPAWIDRLDQHRQRLPIDDLDRLARRRLNSRAIVDPREIAVLPPIAMSAPDPAPAMHQRLLAKLYGAVARRRINSRVAAYVIPANASGTGE